MNPHRRSVARHWGDAIRRQRTLLQISQADLAKAVGVEQGTVSKWERGALAPPVELVPRIAEVLHTAPGVLFQWPPAAPPVKAAV